MRGADCCAVESGTSGVWTCRHGHSIPDGHGGYVLSSVASHRRFTLQKHLIRCFLARSGGNVFVLSIESAQLQAVCGSVLYQKMIAVGVATVFCFARTCQTQRSCICFPFLPSSALNSLRVFLSDGLHSWWLA